MTQLVGILCGDKIWKQVFSWSLFIVIIAILFFIGTFNVLAQGGGADAGSAANPTPPNPGGNVIFYPPTPGPAAGGSGAAGGGSGTGAGSGAVNPPGGVDAIAAQTQTVPVVQAGNTNDPILLALHAIVTAVGWLAGQFGYMFDYAINNYIVGFGDKYINYNIGNIIDNLWSTIRDIFNLTFIFGLVFIGFKMILDSSDSSARKMLVSLIGAALLVNFSLFITKFVVDFSNIAAYQIYKAFAGSAADGGFSLTRAFMNQMGIDTLFNVQYVDGYQYILGLLIVFLILGYVFLAGAIMVIIRFVVLNIYMVFSPLMFLGWVFPSMKGYSTKYWSGFLSQAFFAPAFLLMLYLSYRVADAYKFTGKNFNLVFNPQSATYGGSATSVNEIIPYFAMVIVFLVASIVVAKKMGGTSAAMGIALSDKIRGKAQSFVGRNSVGRSASWMAKNQDTRGGRIASGLLTAASLGTFDNRAQRELYEKGKKAKFGGSYSRSDDKDYAEKVSSNISVEKKKAAANETIRLGLAAGATSEQIMAMQSVVASMGTSQLEGMKDSTRTAIASSMTASQVEALMKSDKIGSDDKAAIGKARAEAITKLVEKNNEVISTELTKLTVEQIEDAGADFINKHAGLFTSTQIDDIKKSKKFNPAQKATFTGARSTYQKTNATTYNTASNLFNTYSGKDANGIAQMKRRKSTDIAAMGADVLLGAHAVNFLEIGDLEAIGDKRTLERSDRDKLKANIEAEAQSGSRKAQDLLNWMSSSQGQRLNW